jgi:hypothetical protein
MDVSVMILRHHGSSDKGEGSSTSQINSGNNAGAKCPGNNQPNCDDLPGKQSDDDDDHNRRPPDPPQDPDPPRTLDMDPRYKITHKTYISLKIHVNGKDNGDFLRFRTKVAVRWRHC